MNNLQVFNNPKFGQLRAIEIEGKPYFFATDIAKLLRFSNTHMAVGNYCKFTLKRTLPYSKNSKRKANVNLIPPKDIYCLASRSRLESAEDFKEWILEEVIPAIKKSSHKTNWISKIKSWFYINLPVFSIIHWN